MFAQQLRTIRGSDMSASLYVDNQEISMKYLTLKIFAMCLMIFFSCSEYPDERMRFDIGKCREERSAFLKAQPLSYSYVCSQCYYSKPMFKLFIQNGKIDSVVNYSRRDTFSLEYCAKFMIDSIFNGLESTYESYPAQEKGNGTPFINEITCKYDSLLHFPFSWEYSYDENGYIGSAFFFNCYKIDSFTVLQK
jgi:hypothetical protein